MLTPAFFNVVNARKLKQYGKRLDNSAQEIGFRREIRSSFRRLVGTNCRSFESYTPSFRGEAEAKRRPSARNDNLYGSDALGRVDIHRSQIMAPTRNSMDANESAVFS